MSKRESGEFNSEGDELLFGSLKSAPSKLSPDASAANNGSQPAKDSAEAMEVDQQPAPFSNQLSKEPLVRKLAVNGRRSLVARLEPVLAGVKGGISSAAVVHHRIRLYRLHHSSPVAEKVNNKDSSGSKDTPSLYPISDTDVSHISDCYAIVWHPDGVYLALLAPKTISIWRLQDTSLTHVYTVGLEGGNGQLQIVQERFVSFQWLGVSRKFLYNSGRSNKTDLLFIRPRLRGPRLLFGDLSFVLLTSVGEVQVFYQTISEAGQLDYSSIKMRLDLNTIANAIIIPNHDGSVDLIAVPKSASTFAHLIQIQVHLYLKKIEILKKDKISYFPLHADSYGVCDLMEELPESSSGLWLLMAAKNCKTLQYSVTILVRKQNIWQHLSTTKTMEMDDFTSVSWLPFVDLRQFTKKLIVFGSESGETIKAFDALSLEQIDSPFIVESFYKSLQVTPLQNGHVVVSLFLNANGEEQIQCLHLVKSFHHLKPDLIIKPFATQLAHCVLNQNSCSDILWSISAYSNFLLSTKSLSEAKLLLKLLLMMTYNFVCVNLQPQTEKQPSMMQLVWHRMFDISPTSIETVSFSSTGLRLLQLQLSLYGSNTTLFEAEYGFTINLLRLIWMKRLFQAVMTEKMEFIFDKCGLDERQILMALSSCSIWFLDFCGVMVKNSYFCLNVRFEEPHHPTEPLARQSPFVPFLKNYQCRKLLRHLLVCVRQLRSFLSLTATQPQMQRRKSSVSNGSANSSAPSPSPSDSSVSGWTLRRYLDATLNRPRIRIEQMLLLLDELDAKLVLKPQNQFMTNLVSDYNAFSALFQMTHLYSPGVAEIIQFSGLFSYDKNAMVQLANVSGVGESLSKLRSILSSHLEIPSKLFEGDHKTLETESVEIPGVFGAPSFAALGLCDESLSWSELSEPQRMIKVNGKKRTVTGMQGCDTLTGQKLPRWIVTNAAKTKTADTIYQCEKCFQFTISAKQLGGSGCFCGGSCWYPVGKVKL